MRRLIRLYPAAWRRRYGAELEQLVTDLRPSRSRAALVMDLVKGAVAAHIRKELVVPIPVRRALRRGLLIAGLVWLALSVEIVLTNVVFPTRKDNDAIPAVLSYLAVFVLLALVGAGAARDRVGVGGRALVGAVTGAVIGVLTVGTFALVDNVWLDVVAQQQAKITGFAQSHAGSMREYINNGLSGAGVVLPLMLAGCGAVLASVGGLLGRPPAPDAHPTT